MTLSDFKLLFRSDFSFLRINGKDVGIGQWLIHPEAQQDSDVVFSFYEYTRGVGNTLHQFLVSDLEVASISEDGYTLHLFNKSGHTAAAITFHVIVQDSIRGLISSVTGEYGN